MGCIDSVVSDFTILHTIRTIYYCVALHLHHSLGISGNNACLIVFIQTKSFYINAQTIATKSCNAHQSRNAVITLMKKASRQLSFEPISYIYHRQAITRLYQWVHLGKILMFYFSYSAILALLNETLIKEGWGCVISIHLTTRLLKLYHTTNF